MEHPILTGTWTNQLGSTMDIQAKDGKITGTYTTGVGNAKIGHDVTGIYVPQQNGCLVSFTVGWTKLVDTSKPQSISSWNGLMVQGKDGRWKIHTTWLLSSWLPEEMWKATNLNKDFFEKQEE